MRCVVLALCCTSCALDPDIIAALTPADAGPELGVDAGPSADASVLCVGVDTSLLMIDHQGGVSRVRADGGVEDVGPSDCLAEGTLSAALDNRGMTWAIAADGTTWTLGPSGVCTPSPIAEGVTDWTFVPRADVARELLYALQDGLVLAYDLTLSSTPSVLTTTTARWLVGSQDGTLYAVDASMQTLVLSQIDLLTGNVTTVSKVIYTEASEPSAVTLWREQFVVAFGSSLFSFVIGDERVSEFVQSATTPYAIDALAASWCAK